MAGNVTAGYTELLAEYERSVGRPQAGMTLRPNEFPHAEVDVVGINGQQVPRQRLAFMSPPALSEEPTFNERLEPLLQPLRERVEAAESVLQLRTAEAEEALSFRNDLERAAASLRNVETGPPRQASLPSPRECFAMTDLQWSRFKESLEHGEHR